MLQKNPNIIHILWIYPPITEFFTNIPTYILPFHEEVNYQIEKKQEETCISLQW